MKVSDYIAARLQQEGVRRIFLITGGGAMHLNDSLGRAFESDDLQYICCHHEQACAMAAEAYARLTGQIGVVNVTTGPGGINALNGVFGAHTDSIPMLVISGQVKRETCMAFHPDWHGRQLGDQEADIIAMARPVTKYAALVREPESIRYHLERALHLARSGRPGPCWLDVPIDVQAAQIEPDELPGYDASEDGPDWDVEQVRRQCRDVVERLRLAQRPVVLVGSGVRLSGGSDIFERVTRQLGVPVATAWTAVDQLDSDDPLFCGRPGVVGDRAGNFAVQNSDVLLVIGSRLPIRQVSYNWNSFARAAWKIQVDADQAELDKPMVRPDQAIHCDAALFLRELEAQLQASAWDTARHADWLHWCRERVARYPVVLPRHRAEPGDDDKPINPYGFVEALFEMLNARDAVVCGDGAASVVPFQAARIQKGQRLFTNAGAASMGYDLPAAIGAACGLGIGEGAKSSRIICLAGDGSIQMNVQELQTLVHHQLPIKVIVMNNGGYLSIRTTQQNFFGLLVGESAQSGVSFPDMAALARAYGLASCTISRPDFQSELREFLEAPGPGLCEIMLDPTQGIEPKLSSRQLPDGRMVSSPLEDLSPFLDREELAQNLLIEPQSE